MGEETANTISTTTNTAATDAATTTQQDPGSTPGEEGASNTRFRSLFEDAPSEADLRGETAETPDSTDSGQKTPADARPKESTANKDDAAVKPPSGFVPHEALKEERMRRQELTQAVENLQRELAAMKAAEQTAGSKPGDAKPAGTAQSDFKVLSDEEYEALLEDDPIEAIKYDRKLQKYQASQKEEQSRQQQSQAGIQAAYARVASSIPELAVEGSDLRGKLVEFAGSLGINQDTLTLITNPGTLIAMPNGGAPVMLGEKAAEVVEALHKIYTKMDASGVRTQIEKEVTERVTKELLGKLSTRASEHRSIGDSPGSGETPTEIPIPNTEAKFARLSKADQERLLGKFS